MSLRNLNLAEPILDSIGEPANGTLMFYVGNTETLANIYDATGTRLSQPVAVSAGHTTTRIYLESNVDVRVVPSFDRSWLDIAPTVGITLQGTEVATFSNVTNLMAAQGLTDEQVVALLGYVDAGDKPLVYYRYHEDGTYEADYGSIIPCTAGGYFEIVEPDIIDVRHWGVFGYASIADASSHAAVGQITAAQSYASAHSKKVHFPDMLFYKVSSGTYDCEYGQLFTSGGIVTVKSENTKLFSNATYYTTWTIESDNVYATQLSVTDMPTIKCKKFIMNTLKEVTLSDCEVYALVNLAYTTLTTWDNVKIYGTGVIVNTLLHIRASDIDPEILDSNLTTVDIQAIFVNCTTNSNLWSDQTKWRAFADVNAQDVVVNDVVASDVECGTVTGNSIISQGDIAVTGTANIGVDANIGGNASITGLATVGGLMCTRRSDWQTVSGEASGITFRSYISEGIATNGTNIESILNGVTYGVGEMIMIYNYSTTNGYVKYYGPGQTWGTGDRRQVGVTSYGGCIFVCESKGANGDLFIPLTSGPV